MENGEPGPFDRKTHMIQAAALLVAALVKWLGSLLTTHNSSKQSITFATAHGRVHDARPSFIPGSMSPRLTLQE